MRKYNDIYSRPAAMNMVEEDGKIWVSLLNRNGICEVDKATRRARIRGIFEGESLDGECLYCHIKKIGNCLIFSPGFAERIAVYNLEDDTINYIPLKKLEYEYRQSQEEAKFWGTVQDHSNIYLLGYSYPAIIKLDMESMEVTYITDWVETINKNIAVGDNSGYFGDGYVIRGDKVLIPVSCMKAILELDLRTDCTKIKWLDISTGGIGGLSSADGENVWMVGKKRKTNKLYCWNTQTDKIMEYSLVNEDENIFDPFYAPICIASKLFLMPMSASSIYEMDINEGQIRKNKELNKLVNDIESPLWPWWKTMAVHMRGNIISFLTCSDLKWHEYNIMSMKSQSYYILLEEDAKEIEKYFKAFYLDGRTKKSMLSEKKISLVYYIDHQVESNDQNLHQRRTGINIGQEIFNQICERT